MLEPIQGCSPTRDNTPVAAGVDLAAVCFNASPILWRAHLIVYALMFVSLTIALFPFFTLAYYWPLLWLAFLGVLAVAIRNANIVKNKQPITLEIKNNQWMLFTDQAKIAVVAKGEILVWEWLIILPLKEILSGKMHYLIALPDSMSKEDWRRLSVWLRICLR